MRKRHMSVGGNLRGPSPSIFFLVHSEVARHHLEGVGYRPLCAGEPHPLLTLGRHPWRRFPPAFPSSTTHIFLCRGLI